jgi:hypothetical protein
VYGQTEVERFLRASCDSLRQLRAAYAALDADIYAALDAVLRAASKAWN